MSEMHTSGCKHISTSTFHIYCMIWTKFSIRDMHIMLCATIREISS